MPRSLENSKRPLTVYLLDLWSFIPYYMAHLCKALRTQSVDARLGSARYHLDRNYFRSMGIQPDPVLLDLGGGLGSSFLRRAIKTFEYVINLFVLGLRISIFGLDILHVQFTPFLDRGFTFEICFLKWMRSRGVRIVLTIHNLPDRDSRSSQKRLYQAAYACADAIICHGSEAREKLISDFEVQSKKIRVIAHGPLFGEKPRDTTNQARHKLGLSADETLVLCAGVVSEYKGIPFLLDAWKRTSTSNSKSRLIVAGTGDSGLLGLIRAKVEMEGLSSSVDLWLRFITVAELPLLYQAADILVYPYKAGTTSGALLTGMNYGKAIVTTRLPFFREHLAEEVEAKMVEYGDVESMAKVLSELINDPERRMRLAASLSARPSKNDPWREIACETIECYRTCPSASDSDSQ